MTNLTGIEKIKFEKLFGMQSGYVLDFTNNSFEDFVLSSVNKNIWLNKYDFRSGSKANRLRKFWDIESNKVVGKLLLDLLEYWKTRNISIKKDSIEYDLYNDCKKIAASLYGTSSRSLSPRSNILLKTENFDKKDFKNLNLDKNLEKIIEERLDEIDKCLSADSPLACIFLCGSTLEGILLNIATNNIKIFNKATSSPKDKITNKVLPIKKWSLANLIDVATELGFIKKDVQKFSHVLRDFRNYIHPNQQLKENFNPDNETAKLCVQVLKTSIFQISKK